MAKLVAGGPMTHGDILRAIFDRYPHFLCKSWRTDNFKRKRVEKQQGFISKAAICNELGSMLRKHSHSHMYCQTVEKYTFAHFKKLFFKMFGIKIADIRRPVNFRECVRYCTKEDNQAVILNIPMKFTSTMYRAYKYHNECGNAGIIYGDYIPSTVVACDRKVFESVVQFESKLQDAGYIYDRVECMQLVPWQEQLIVEMGNVQESNRAVIWVVDVPGGAGKSLMCQWLMSQGIFGKGILFQEMDYRTNSYLYNSERLVLFDLPRSSTPADLRFIEDLKNGYLICTKYECKQKIFGSPVIVVFANEYPVKTLLSVDRWYVFHIKDTTADGLRTGNLIRHPEYNELNTMYNLFSTEQS